MTTPTMNGIKLRDDEYLKDQTNNTLSMMLGANGMPKYSAAEIKNKNLTKPKLLAELLPIYNALQAELPAKEKKVGAKRGRKRGASTNKKSAQVKKCNMIASLAQGKLSVNEAKEWLAQDYLLASITTLEEIEKAANGIRPGRGRHKNNDNANDGYIVAKGQGE